MTKMNMVTKIIHVGSSYKIGLTNQEVQLAISYGRNNGILALVVAGENEQYKGCYDLLRKNNIQFKIIKGFDDHYNFFRLVKEFSNVVTDFSPQIVTVNTNWQLIIAGLARLLGRTKFKIIYTIHGFRHNSKRMSVLARYMIGTILLLFSDKINAPTSYVASKFSFLKSKIYTIPLGEDDIFFENSSPPDFSSARHFLFAGAFRNGKNQDVLIRGFAKYLKLTRNNGSKLFLPGEGELLGKSIDLARMLGISERVVFPGQLNRSEMLALYKHCQIALVPSNDETFGHCIAEPLVMRRIVISRNIGLAQDFLVNRKNGFLYDTEDQLVQCLLEVDKMDQANLVRISESAGVTGLHFRWGAIATRHQKEIFEPMLLEG